MEHQTTNTRNNWRLTRLSQNTKPSPVESSFAFLWGGLYIGTTFHVLEIFKYFLSTCLPSGGQENTESLIGSPTVPACYSVMVIFVCQSSGGEMAGRVRKSALDQA